MKILQILPELNSGGVERGVIETNREFSYLNHKSHVVSNGGVMVKQLIADGGHHHELNVCSKNPLTAPFRIKKLGKLIDCIEPEIVHARSRVPAWMAYFSKKRRAFRLITTVHGLNSVNSYSKIMTLGERVICVSEVVRDYIIKNYNTNPDIIRVIQRGVDMKSFDPAFVDKERVEKFKDKYYLNDKFVVSSIGRITWLKDYETFIRAIAKICKHTPETRGLIVGSCRKDKTGYLRSLKKLVSDFNLQEKIIFIENQHDIRPIYNASNVVVNMSLKMGNMGRTVVEALALGKPVVATTFQGLDNLIENGTNGFIIGNRDVEALSKAVEQISNMDFCKETIRKTVPKEFTLEYMTQSILSVYNELV